jgi:competence protein ComGC
MNIKNKGSFVLPIIIILLNIIELFLLIYINNVIYSGVIRYSICFGNYFVLIFFSVSKINKKSKENNIAYLVVTLLLIIIIPVLLWYNKPAYTYNQAIEKIKNQKSIIVIPTNAKSLRMINSPNIFINGIYLIRVKEAGEVKTYGFNPINGDYYLSENIN